MDDTPEYKGSCEEAIPHSFILKCGSDLAQAELKGNSHAIAEARRG